MLLVVAYLYLNLNLDSADQPHRQIEDGADQLEDAIDGNADETERDKDQPDKGIGDERKQRQRPAEDEENAPEKKFDHGVAAGSESCSNPLLQIHTRL
jgi:hypothetical protein